MPQVSNNRIERGTQNDTAPLYKGKGVIVDGECRYVLTTGNDGTVTIMFENGNCNISQIK